MSDSLQPQTVARQAAMSMGFSRQEYQSRLPLPIPGTVTVVSPALADRFFTTSATWEVPYWGKEELNKMR